MDTRLMAAAAAAAALGLTVTRFMDLGFPAMARSSEVITVTIGDLAFAPADVAAHVGDTVLWRNNDILDHTATDEAQGWDVAVPSGQSGEIVLQTPGTFAYICRYHPNMTGTIRVSP